MVMLLFSYAQRTLDASAAAIDWSRRLGACAVVALSKAHFPSNYQQTQTQTQTKHQTQQ